MRSRQTAASVAGVPSICLPGSWAEPDTHLRTLLHHPWYKILVQLIDEICYATVVFYREKSIRSIFAPVTTGSISSPMGKGSDSLPVRALIANRATYLADSMQFMLEVGTRIHLPGAYYIGCSFRGEDVDERHLCQFAHSEVEICGGFDDIISLAEQYIYFLTRHLYEHCAESIYSVAGDVCHLERCIALGGHFRRIRFTEAMSALGSNSEYFREVVAGGWSITQAGEKRLLQEAGEAIWLTHLPRLTSPFYQQPDGETPYCLSADLLMGQGEVLGSGARCRDEQTLLASLQFHEVNPEDYGWYLEMKRTMPVQTAGFGLGLERFLLWLTKTSDIREMTLCLRDNERTLVP